MCLNGWNDNFYVSIVLIRPVTHIQHSNELEASSQTEPQISSWYLQEKKNYLLSWKYKQSYNTSYYSIFLLLYTKVSTGTNHNQIEDIDAFAINENETLAIYGK